jgi:hypothetical protein
MNALIAKNELAERLQTLADAARRMKPTAENVVELNQALNETTDWFGRLVESSADSTPVITPIALRR